MEISKRQYSRLDVGKLIYADYVTDKYDRSKGICSSPSLRSFLYHGTGDQQ